MIDVEICINSDTIPAVREAVSTAYRGGATTVELCSEMALEGLTPPKGHIAAARDRFQRPGLMVMIRPRSGNFHYSTHELEKMIVQIEMAADAGADGVVFGVLRADRRIDLPALHRLVEASRTYQLRTTFHRAIDATPDPAEALEVAITCGVDRVLTAGVPWGQPGGAFEGATRIAELVRRAAARIEIVIAGGVTPTNVTAILDRMPRGAERLAVHAYSGVQRNGLVALEAVRALVATANAADPRARD